MIQIYNPDNTDYDVNGDMTLRPTECSVHAILNGTWEATMVHPIDDEGRWAYIVEDAVVKLPSFNGEQLFRVKDVKKKDTGVTAAMEPIFYDCIGDCFLVDVRPTDKSGQDALDILTAVNSKYSAESDIDTKATAYYEYKNLLEALCGDIDNNFVKRWGGEILYDNYKVIVNTEVGGDYGVVLRYGKNIPVDGLSEEVDTREVVTRIYPKAFNGYVMSDNGYVDSPLIGNYPTIHAATVTFDDVKMEADESEDDEEDGTIICSSQAELDAALKAKCEAQFDAGLDQPTVTIEADMVMLETTDLYKDYAVLEEVSLGDTIHCQHTRLGIITDSRVIELEYDCILRRVESVVLGEPSYDYFADVSSAVEQITSVVREDGTVMADKIAGYIDGSMASLYAQYSAAKQMDYLAVLFENLDESSSLYGAMAMGTQGLMISKTRTSDDKDWVWTTALTSDGLIADTIVAGTLSDATGSNYWDLDNGILVANNATISGTVTATAGSIGGWVITSTRIKSSSTISIGNAEAGLLLINEPSDSKPWLHVQDSNGYTVFQLSYSGAITVTGKLTVMNGSATGGYLGYMTGATPSSTTSGIGIQSTNTGNYVIATTAGVRMQAGTSTCFFLTEGYGAEAYGTYFYVYSPFAVRSGDLTVSSGSVYVSSGSVYVSSGSVWIGNDNALYGFLYGTTSSGVWLIGINSSNVIGVGNSGYRMNLHGSAFYFDSNIYVDKSSASSNANVYVYGAITSGCMFSNYSTGYFGLYNGTLGLTLIQMSSAGAVYMGSTSYATYLRGSTVYSNVSITVSSDERLKTDFGTLDDYDTVFDALNPLTFRYRSGGGINMGFTYQCIVAALESAGLNADDHAVVSTYTDEEAGQTYGAVAYEQIIALLTDQVQKLKSRVQALENEVSA